MIIIRESSKQTVFGYFLLVGILIGAMVIARACEAGQRTAATQATTSNVTGTISGNSQSLIKKQFGPFKISAGPDTTGAFAVNLDGTQEIDHHISHIVLRSGQRNPFFDTFASLGYSAKGTWNTDPSKASNGTLSLKPGLTSVLYVGPYIAGIPSTWPQPKVGLSGFTDVKYRYGTVLQGTTLKKVNQLDVGAGGYIALPVSVRNGDVSILASPRLSFTYYHPAKTTGGVLSLPTGITANYVQMEFHTTLGLFRKGEWGVGYENYPFTLDVTYDGSRPISGKDRTYQNLVRVQLSTTLIGADNVYPSITYQSGKEGGFRYDKEVILGALIKFLAKGS